MKKLFFIFLLLVLPFQMSWAVGSTYCQHESGVSAKHFGHHDHQHTGQDDENAKRSSIVKIDADCAHCSLSNVGVLTPIFTMLISSAAFHPVMPFDPLISFTPFDRPERPKWIIAI